MCVIFIFFSTLLFLLRFFFALILCSDIRYYNNNVRHRFCGDCQVVAASQYHHQNAAHTRTHGARYTYVDRRRRRRRTPRHTTRTEFQFEAEKNPNPFHIFFRKKMVFTMSVCAQHGLERVYTHIHLLQTIHQPIFDSVRISLFQ